MKVEQKFKATRRLNKCSRNCFVCLGVFIVIVLFVHFGRVRFGTHPSLRLVMETYYFGDGLAELTGDTSILEHVVTESVLQYTIDHCQKGLCNGSRPPHVIGDYFNVLRETDEFAVVELEQRPIITDRGGTLGSYLIRCYSLVRDGDAWRVSGGYLDCDGYLPEKYK